MKRVVLLILVALLFATVTWVDSSARDTPWRGTPDRDTGDDHPWGGEQLRPDDGPVVHTTSGTTITRYFLVDVLTGILVDYVSDWYASYRLYTVPTTSGSGNTATTTQQPNQSTSSNQGQ